MYPLEDGVENMQSCFGEYCSEAPATQGFYIHNPSGNTSFTIPASARIHSNTTFLKSVRSVTNGLLIDVTGDVNNYTDKISVHFDPNATSEYDPGFDAYKLWGLKEAPQLYTRIGDINVTCNSMPFDKKNIVIHMGFRCGLNGQYMLKADSLGTFDNNIVISLEDLKLNATQDLKLNPSYSFTYDTLDDSNRFVLHFDDVTFRIDDIKNIQPLQIYSFGDCIYVKSQDEVLKEGKIFVYDLLGKELFYSKLLNQSLNKIIPNLEEGYYLVKVISNNRMYNGKVFLKRSP